MFTEKLYVFYHYDYSQLVSCIQDEKIVQDCTLYFPDENMYVKMAEIEIFE